MSTEKQIIANKQNAQLATGPKTTSGKEVVSKNAIKHGIFTKDLIVSSDIENENEDEYQSILNNLVDCLLPCNQIESLLVEKIATDFWRLRRTIKFETGSIVKNIQSLLNEFYSYECQNNEKIDQEIYLKEKNLEWNTVYIQCLLRGEVTFDQPEWQGNNITSDIVEDFYILAKSLSSLTKGQKERLYYRGGFTFDELGHLLKMYGYSDAKMVTEKLLEIYSKQNRRLEEEIQLLIKKKAGNDTTNKLLYMLGMTPQTDNAEKVLKYERSLQKSIFQNLFMLKKLQGNF